MRVTGRRQLRPLLDDLLQSEWFLSVRDATNGSPEFALVIRLNPDRAGLWQTNLANILESWTGLSAEKIRGGWELKKHLPPDLIRFVRAGDWVVFGWGQDELPLNNALVRRVSRKSVPRHRKGLLVERGRGLGAVGARVFIVGGNEFSGDAI